tara:strand:- start:4428 stop:4718 length:291 start_codon:yes stop_codon:yes gene_type:complete
MNDRVKCADGFSMSVQANRSAYCSPRVDNADKYDEVEVGFPSDPEPLILSYGEQTENPTQTVYGFVPVQTVALVIVKHGGIVSGDLPPGVPYLGAS